jgi:hypothetical protein
VTPVSRGPSLRRTIETLADVARKNHAPTFTVKMPDGTEVTWNSIETLTEQQPVTDNEPNEIDIILEQRKKKRREKDP